jgi:SPOR domain
MDALTLSVDWEALGAEAAASLDGMHALVLTGPDPVATAKVALGIGRSQSRTRRVAIGDLIGDVEPLQRLVTGDDPHGIVDSFLYGVSLNKIARQVDDSGMLFIMPSGTEPVVTADIIRNDRWTRLSAGFREVGALLILVTQSDSEGVRELAAQLDGALTVGDASAANIPQEMIRGAVDAAAPITMPNAPPVPSISFDRPAPSLKPTPIMLPTQEHVTDTRAFNPFPEPDAGQRKKFAAVAVLVTMIGAWFAMGRPGMAKSDAPATPAPVVAPADTASPVAPTDSAGSTVSRQADSVSALQPANPQDSAKAAAYGVVVVATNDEAQALARWADLGLNLPAGTVTMVRIRGERGRFFQMQAGAYAKASQADSLLKALRSSGKLQPDAGRMVATPFALMLEAKVSRRAAQNVADGYGQRQIAAYALLQPDGSATIFVGAFEAADQAAPLMNELKAKGVSSTLYYRTGRSF